MNLGMTLAEIRMVPSSSDTKNEMTKDVLKGNMDSLMQMMICMSLFMSQTQEGTGIYSVIDFSREVLFNISTETQS